MVSTGSQAEYFRPVLALKQRKVRPLQSEMGFQVTAFCAHICGMSRLRESKTFPQFPDPEEQTIIIFDWDDTWLPQ